MKKLFTLLLMSALLCPMASMAKDNLPADLKGIKLSPVHVEYFSTDGTIEISFNATVPANYFDRRTTFVLMPSIQLSNDEIIQLPCKGVQGTSVVDTNYPVVDWSKERVISYTEKTPVKAVLLNAQFHIDVYLYHCLSRESRTERIFSAPLNSLISSDATGSVGAANANPFGMNMFPMVPPIAGVGPAGYVAADKDGGFAGGAGETKPEGRIFYKVNSYTITKEGVENPSFKKMNEMLTLLMQDPEFTITQVDIFGNASPEGTDRINIPLAANRAKSAVTYMKQNLKNIGYKKALRDDQYTIVGSTIFWEEFFRAMSASNHPEKSQVISRFLNFKEDPNESERKVRVLMSEDQTIRDIMFPDLRYSAIRVSFDRAAMNQEKLAEAARLYPDILSAQELAKAAEAEPSLEKRVEMYQSAIALHPTTWELYANLGRAYLNVKNYDAALEAFNNALKLSPDNPKVKAQLAALYTITGQYDKATQALSGMSGAEANYYRGLILGSKGQYEQAIILLQDYPDVNLAIAYLNVFKTKEALDVLQKLDQDNVYTAYYTGVALRRLNKANEAEAYFSKAYRLNKGELDNLPL